MLFSLLIAGIWDAKGISYDFYEAFMGMASATMDLRLIKKLSLNSINYTTLDSDTKDKCLNMFNTKWHKVMRLWTSQQQNQPKVVLNPNLNILIDDYIRKKWKYKIDF